MNQKNGQRDLAVLVVAQRGALEALEDPFEPYRLLDPAGRPVTAVAAFLSDLQACGRATTTQRSYAMALLRWFRFLWAIEVPWDQATRPEARDFCRFIEIVDKQELNGQKTSGAANPVTGKAPPGSRYAPATRAHSESVLRGFYEFHLDAGTGPMVNPFPLARSGGARANEHHNPMDPFRRARSGLFRPRVVERKPAANPR